MRLRKRKTTFVIKRDLFSVQLRVELLRENIDDMPVQLFHFVVTQGSLVGTIFQSQGNGSFAVGNVRPLVDTNEFCIAAGFNFLVDDALEQVGQRHPPFNQQRDIANYRWVTREWSIQRQPFLGSEQRRQIQFGKVDGLAKLVRCGDVLRESAGAANDAAIANSNR